MQQRNATRRHFLQYGLAAAAAGPWVLRPGETATDTPAAEEGSNSAISCNVAIIGGGAGGIHSAYQLAGLPASNPNSDVCVFEKQSRLGGRIFDVALDPLRPDLVFGAGALRVMETQNYVLQLAEDLGITLKRRPGATTSSVHAVFSPSTPTGSTNWPIHRSPINSSPVVVLTPKPPSMIAYVLGRSGSMWPTIRTCAPTSGRCWAPRAIIS